MTTKHLLPFLVLLFLGFNLKAQLVITEINYNDPSGGFNGDSLEYIEIINNGADSVDIAAYTLASGLTFTFPAMVMPAGSYLVIARNQNAVQNFYGITGVLQWDAGQTLANNGEAIVIRDSSGLTIDSVRYYNALPWPTGANGTGSSMMLCDPSLDNNAGINWVNASPVNATMFGLVNNLNVMGTPGSGCISVPVYNPSFATFPFFESFDSAWINGDGYRDVPSGHWKNSTAGGNTSVRRNDDGAAASWTNAANGVYTPAAANNSLFSARYHTSTLATGNNGWLDLYIDLSPAGMKQLDFWYINTSGADVLNLLLSTDSGTTFNTLGTYAAGAGWQHISHVLGNITGAQCLLRFEAAGATGNNSDIGIDEVSLTFVPPADAGIASIVSPGSPFISTSVPLEVVLANYGADTMTSVNLNWSVNGVIQTPVPWTGQIGPVSSSQVFTMTTFNPPLTGLVSLKVWTSDPNGQADPDPSNDTASATTYYQNYASFPYYQGFDSAWTDFFSTRDLPDIYWSNTPATGSNSWRRDDDGAGANWTNAGTGAYIPAGAVNTAHSARFHTAGSTPGSTGVLKLYVNLNVPGMKELSFWHINAAGNDSLAVWISADGGATFTFLTKAITEANWTLHKINLGLISDSNTVFMFRSTAVQSNSDIGLDEVRLSLVPPNDAGVEAIVSPGPVFVNPAEPLDLVIRNYGSDTLATVNLNWSVNGVLQTAVPWTGQLAPLTGSQAFTMITFNPPLTGLVTLKVWTSDPNGQADPDPSNDTASAATYHQNYASFPYYQGFDSAWNDFFSTRDLPDLYWSNTPATGSNSWRRDDDGAGANWTNAGTGAYMPAGAVNTAHSARFHTAGSTPGSTGVLKLHVNLNVPGMKEMSFWHINAAGNDSLAIWMSTDGGATYTFLTKFTNVANWTKRILYLGSPSDTNTVLMFRSSTVQSNSDIGLDEVRLNLVQPDAGVAEILSPLSGCSIPPNTDLVVKVRNFGILPFDSLAVVTPNGTFYVTDTMQPGDSVLVNAGPFFVAPGSDSSFAVYTMLSGDNLPSNDTLHHYVRYSLPINTFPFLENFESGSSYYVDLTGNTNSSATIVPLIGNNGGTGIRMTGLQAGTWPGGSSGTTTAAQAFGYTDHVSSVTSSCLVDATALVSPELLLDLRQTYSTGPRYCFFRVVVNDTIVLANQDGVTDFNALTQNNDLFVTQKFDLSTFAGTIFNLSLQASTKYDDANAQGGIGDKVFVDNLVIREKPPYDVGVIAITAPQSGCGLGASEAVTVMVKNFGSDTAFAFPTTVTITGGYNQTTMTQQLLPGDTAIITFPQVNLSAPGNYDILAFTQLTGDLETKNDSLFKNVVNTPYINTFPYLQDFESSNSGWSSGVIAGNNNWIIGNPVKPNINAAHSGTHCWVTDTLANYSNASESYVLTNCFDLSTINNPMLGVWLFIRTQNNVDAMILESSVSGGAWTKVIGDAGFYNNNSNQGGLAAPKWSGQGTAWVHYQTSIFGLAGNSSVQFRFRFLTSATVNDQGIAIDDFEIFEATPDLSITQFFQPASGCGLGSTETVQVMVSNVGPITVYNPPVLLKVDNGSWITELVNDSLTPGMDYMFTFSATANLSTPGMHTLTATPGLSNDMNHANDTLTTSVSSLGSISNPPVMYDFETSAFADYLGLTDAGNSAIGINPTGGVLGSTCVAMTGNQAGAWPGGTGQTTTAAEAYSYTDHIAKIFSCDVYLSAGPAWALTLDLRQTFSTGPMYSWFRVMLNDSIYLPEIGTGDTTFNPATDSLDHFATHLFDLSAYASPLRLSLESSNKYSPVNSQNGIGDNAFVDNVGIVDVNGLAGIHETDLLLYPNPARDHINLQFFLNPAKADIRLVDALGRLLKIIATTESSVVSIPIQDLPSGLFTLLVTTRQGMRAVKFVKID